MIQELVLIKEFHCPICRATDLYVLQDPEISSKFIITRVDSVGNNPSKFMAIFDRYSDMVGAEIYPTVMLGLPEIDYYPYIFHVWKQKKNNGGEEDVITAEEHKKFKELKMQILKYSKVLEVERLVLPKDYNLWRKTYGLV